MITHAANVSRMRRVRGMNAGWTIGASHHGPLHMAQLSHSLGVVKEPERRIELLTYSLRVNCSAV